MLLFDGEQTRRGETMEIKLGFSTGALYKTSLDIVDRLRAIKGTGCRIVELNFLRLEELNLKQLAKLAPRLDDFDHVGLHAPKHDYGQNDTTRRVFDSISELNEKRVLDMVVFHPDTVIDFGVFADVPFRVALENMDNRKGSYKTAAELEELFTRFPNFSMVLDVNHAFSNDPTTKLAADFYEKLGPKISWVHLSGYAGGHEPLFQTKQLEIIRSIWDFGMPIIIESVLAADELERERDFILQAIDGMRQ